MFDKKNPLFHVPREKHEKTTVPEHTGKVYHRSEAFAPGKGECVFAHTLGRQYSTNFIKVSDFVKECLK